MRTRPSLGALAWVVGLMLPTLVLAVVSFHRGRVARARVTDAPVADPADVAAVRRIEAGDVYVAQVLCCSCGWRGKVRVPLGRSVKAVCCPRCKEIYRQLVAGGEYGYQGTLVTDD